MQALQIIEPGRAELIEAPTPEPSEGEVLVKVLGISTCPHWDIHMMTGEPMFPGQNVTYPLTPGQPGHEMTGEVVAVGPGVSAPAVGTRVAAWQDRGGNVAQGCYAQYVAFRTESLMTVAPNLEPHRIASLELAMCVQVSFDQLVPSDTVRGKRFGVSGLGPAGLIAVQMAKACGAAEVIGIDPLVERRDAADRLGADRVIPADEDLPAGRFAPTALDAAIDCTGLKLSIEYLIGRTRRVVAIFGVLREEVIFPSDCWRGGFALLGYGSHNRNAAEQAYELIVKGDLDLAPLITQRLPLGRYIEGVNLLRNREAIKILFAPWD